MINLKRILGTVVILGAILCIWLGEKWYAPYTVEEDIAPLVFLDEDSLQFYHLQNGELREAPIERDLYPSYARFDINKEKREEIILELLDGIMPAIYNYETDEMEQLGDAGEVHEISSLYSGERSEYRFVPGSNNISFTIYDRIYVYEYGQEHYKEVYRFNYDCYMNLGFSYEWKNDEEMYLIKAGDFILYNVETKKEEIILEDIGSVYFQMSDDGHYVTYQEQWGDAGRRKIYLVDLQTMEEKEIYTAKSDYLVKAEFSPDSQYILIMDHHRDNHRGKRYFYLYDMGKERKYRLNIDKLPLGTFTGWGK